MKKKLLGLVLIMTTVLLAACGPETMESLNEKNLKAMNETESLSFEMNVNVKEVGEVKVKGKALGLSPKSKIKDIKAYAEVSLTDLSTEEGEMKKLEVYIMDGYMHAYDGQKNEWEKTVIEQAESTLQELYEEMKEEEAGVSGGEQAEASYLAISKLIEANMLIEKEKNTHVVSFQTTPDLIGKIIEEAFKVAESIDDSAELAVDPMDEETKTYIDMIKNGLKIKSKMAYDKNFNLTSLYLNMSFENDILTMLVGTNKIDVETSAEFFDYNEVKDFNLPEDAPK